MACMFRRFASCPACGLFHCMHRIFAHVHVHLAACTGFFGLVHVHLIPTGSGDTSQIPSNLTSQSLSPTLFRSQLFNNSISQYGFSITQSSARMSCTSCSPPMRRSMAAMNFSPRFSGWVGSSGFWTTHREKVRRALVASSESLDCSLHR